MQKRCYQPDKQNYQAYGGRGIGICEEWKDDFSAFFEWAIQSGWERGLQIDRIDNNGDYSPQNCRWVTSAFNNQHRRNNKLSFREVREMRRLHREDGMSGRKLAKKFGVSASLACRIIKNENWKEISHENN